MCAYLSLINSRVFIDAQLLSRVSLEGERRRWRMQRAQQGAAVETARRDQAGKPFRAPQAVRLVHFDIHLLSRLVLFLQGVVGSSPTVGAIVIG